MKKITQIEPSLGDEEKQGLIEVIDSGWFTEAEKTREFEKQFAKFVGSKYACVVTSGTAALFVGLKALGISKKDEVIVPDLTFVASPNSIEMACARTVLVDIESHSLNLDLDKVSKMITKKTGAIMPVDFNGRSTDILQLRELADKNGILLIEDACHAIGSFYGKKHMGTISDVGVFSFSTPKIITTGQGGMIVTNDKEVYEKCQAVKDLGRKMGAKKDMKKAFDHPTLGYNFKFTEFQAAIGLAQMEKLKKRIARKKEMFQMYRDLLSDIREIDFVDTELKNITPWMVDIILKTPIQRNRLISYLEKKQIGTRIFYPPIHRLKPYKESNRKYRISSQTSDRGLWLPSSVTLTDNELDKVCKEIKNFFN